MARANNPQNIQTPGAPQMAGPASGDVFGQAAGAYGAALQGPNIQPFINPFTRNVVGTTMGELDRSRQMALGQIGAQATQAGAFGGSRHGVAEAETNRGFMDTAARTAAGLYSQGFDTALGAAERQQQMQSQLAGQGFGFGQAITQQQMQQGAMQQALQQQLIDAARGQFTNFTNFPQQALQLRMAATGSANMGQGTTTQTQQPGLLGILGAGASFLGGLCWVAREVYGDDDPRWTEFRHWLLTAAPKWLLRAYAAHGEAFAGVVRKVPALKKVLRPLMDRARRSAGFGG